MFEWIKKIYEIDLKIIDRHLKDYVEIREKRNNIIHNGSKINQKYISQCVKYGIKWKKNPIIDSEISTSQSELHRAIFILTIIGLTIAYDLWKKISKDNNIIYKSALHTNYDLIGVSTFSDFTSYIFSHRLFKKINILDNKTVSEEMKYCYINYALALKNVLSEFNYRHKNKPTKGDKILQNDFDNQLKNIQQLGQENRLYLLMFYALSDLEDEFCKLMLKHHNAISNLPKNEVKPSIEDYFTWKIFSNLRKNKKFKKNFKIIFKKDFDKNYEKFS